VWTPGAACMCGASGGAAGAASSGLVLLHCGVLCAPQARLQWLGCRPCRSCVFGQQRCMVTKLTRLGCARPPLAPRRPGGRLRCVRPDAQPHQQWPGPPVLQLRAKGAQRQLVLQVRSLF
jgi:hypothetical protein